ncbi:hypothetical protein Acr_06g0009140 [Actinidia rufa]|uniref:Uncharacterized protein n=1 Tax=Actinidia rufa TaxID=165716 RepID=A0A7J0ER54_9ERIC|nr:hypothetical protein Acr_06g0009140 [Actinidia rufa]
MARDGSRWRALVMNFRARTRSPDSIAPPLSLFEVHIDSGKTIVRRLAAAQKLSDIEDIIEHQKKYPDITNEGFAVRLICLYGKSGGSISPKSCPTKCPN